MGKDGQIGTLLVTPVPTMVKLAWDRLPQPAVYLPVVAQGPQVKARDRMPKEGSQLPPVLQMPRLGPYGSGMCHPSQDFKTCLGELRECRPTPHQHQLQQPTVGPQHSLPDPKPKLAILKATQKKGWPEVAPLPFLNPDPVTHLVGHSNEAPMIVDGQEMTTPID